MGKKLGEGAMGTVWAVDSQLYPNVVLKKGRYDRVEAEAERLSQLVHPNVEKVFALLESEDVNELSIAYMAVEKLGPSIQDMLDGGYM